MEAKDGNSRRSDSEQEDSPRCRNKRSETPETDATDDVDDSRAATGGRIVRSCTDDDGQGARASFIGGNTKDVFEGDVER